MSDDLRAALEPRTEAGRTLLTKLDYIGAHSLDTSFPMALDDILAIEAEATALATSDGLDELTAARLIHEANHQWRLPTLTCMTKHRAKAKRALAALRSTPTP